MFAHVSQETKKMVCQRAFQKKCAMRNAVAEYLHCDKTMRYSKHANKSQETFISMLNGLFHMMSEEGHDVVEIVNEAYQDYTLEKEIL